jgi:hypothetical protein
MSITLITFKLEGMGPCPKEEVGKVKYFVMNANGVCV